MFDALNTNDVNDVADLLETTPVVMFGNVEQDSAAQRMNLVIAKALRQGNDVKELPLSEQLGFITDTVLVAEGLVEMLETNEDVRSLLVSIGGAELLGQSINIRRSQLNDARTALCEMKKRFH